MHCAAHAGRSQPGGVWCKPTEAAHAVHGTGQQYPPMQYMTQVSSSTHVVSGVRQHKLPIQCMAQANSSTHTMCGTIQQMPPMPNMYGQRWGSCPHIVPLWRPHSHSPSVHTTSIKNWWHQSPAHCTHCLLQRSTSLSGPCLWIHCLLAPVSSLHISLLPETSLLAFSHADPPWLCPPL
jgi:hypothetical protein